MKKSVISLVSYDAHMLQQSIKSYYPYVDEIILGLDEDRITWSGNKFSFDEDLLWKNLKSIDTDKKISIIEHNFHENSVAIENDNFERNYLKEQCSHDWIFSFDADEVLINPRDFFINYIPIVEKYASVRDLVFTWILPYKELENDYLVIANEDGSFFSGDVQSFATYKTNIFTYCRWTNNKKTIKSPLAILHWSFCRKPEEVQQKINNFGHSDKTPTDPFFGTWNQVDETNFQQLRNFKTSGYGSQQWNKLIKVPKDQLMRAAQLEATRIY